MTIPASHKPAREWLWLVVALVVVAALAAPFWETFTGAKAREDWAKWDEERVKRLFIGPEQVLCYVCAVWAALILQSRYREVIRQRRAFGLELLPTEEGARILPEDARPLARKVEQVTAGRPYILANMIRLGLGKFAISKSAPDVGEVVRNQADVELSRLVTGMSTVNYLAWAIPAIGFVGTVRGLAGAFGVRSPSMGPPKPTQAFADPELAQKAFDAQAAAQQAYMDKITGQLGIAFDCTLVALLLSLLVMYFIHSIQRAEEVLVTDAQQYCQEHLLLRLYDPAAEGTHS